MINLEKELDFFFHNTRQKLREEMNGSINYLMGEVETLRQLHDKHIDLLERIIEQPKELLNRIIKLEKRLGLLRKKQLN